MKRVRVMTIFGTRPEAIKMAPLVKELEGRETLESLCCVTAQHREMLDSVLDIFGLGPVRFLDSSATAMNCVVVMNVWKGIGYYALLSCPR